jgi:hypothetical protein
MKFPLYVALLNEYLDPFYQTKAVVGGHDWLHVRDVAAMGSKIHYLDFDLQEFEVAALLHNTDRSVALKEKGAEFGGWEGFLRHLLKESPFSSADRDRIVFAVLNHSKKTLPAGTPDLAIALQDADKLVRFRPSNLLYAGAHGGSMGVPAFLSTEPFGFTSTREKDRTSMWLGFMGNLEWVGMLSCDRARELIDPDYLRLFLEYLRAFGRETSEHVGCQNMSELDIKKALGNYYDWAIECAGMAVPSFTK